MEKVRLGVIGVGGMGQAHCKSFKDIEEVELVAVSDVFEETADKVAKEYNVEKFTDYKALIDSNLVDAVIVATPHYQHPEISIYAMEKGLHVLSEKPIAVNVSSADAMIKTAKKTKRVFSVMYQLRTSALYKTAKKIIEDGKLGAIYRTSMTFTSYRTQAYYDSGGWRGTYKGEGGGILTNQAPHLLDMFTWLAGLPSRVTAVVNTRRHKIEVEDEAFALLEYPNGAMGTIIGSVNEIPRGDRVEICGETGKLIIDDGKLRLANVKTPIQEFTDNSKEMWSAPESSWEDVPVTEEKSGHDVIIRNFARAILYKEKLISPGKEGINSVELADAIVLSGKSKKSVKVPVSRKKFDDLLRTLIDGSKGK